MTVATLKKGQGDVALVWNVARADVYCARSPERDSFQRREQVLNNRCTVIDEDCRCRGTGKPRLREERGFPALLVGTYRNLLRGWFDDSSDLPRKCEI